MEIGAQLDEALKTAMKARDQRTLDVVRMVRAKMTERLKVAGAPEAADDALWQEVIGAYVKQMKKGAEEFRKVGERGAQQLAQLEFEIDYLAQYLPQQLEGDALKSVVQAAIESTGASSPKDLGRVMGAVMKDHKGRVDGNAVRQAAMSLLG